MDFTKEIENLQDLMFAIRGRLTIMSTLNYSECSLREQEVRFGITRVSEDTKKDIDIVLNILDNISYSIHFPTSESPQCT